MSFDENLYLESGIRFDVLNLPTTAVYEGVHFSDLIRIPALRGEYAEVTRKNT